jgi:hypothetical protein
METTWPRTTWSHWNHVMVWTEESQCQPMKLVPSHLKNLKKCNYLRQTLAITWRVIPGVRNTGQYPIGALCQ